MSKLMSTSYTTGSFNVATLLLRLGAAGLIIPSGYDKLKHFTTYKTQFINFLGLGMPVSLALCIFAELACALLLLIGLFSRWATIPLIINMVVIIFVAGKGDIFGKEGHAALFLMSFVVLLITGPGKISVDGMAGK